MSISVIIPTFNGAHKLPFILHSLEKQTFLDFELIIVVDGSTDGSIELLKNYKTNLFSFKMVYQDNKGRASVRNRGVEEAIGELLIFFDDDIRLLPDTIYKHKYFHGRNSECLLFGKVMLDPEKVKGDDFSSFRVSIEKDWSKNHSSGIHRVSLDNYAFTTANLSCRRSVFYKIGKFDEMLKDSEDFDFSLRALEKNIPIFFDYDMLVWHDDYISLDKYIKRQIQYIESKQLLGHLKPAMVNMHPASFSYGATVSLLKKMLSHFFVLNKAWEFILKSNIYHKLLPISLRNKIYSLVIFSSVISSLKRIK